MPAAFCARFPVLVKSKKVTRRRVGLRSMKLLVAREKKLVVPRVILQGIKQKKCIIHCWASRWFLLIYSPEPRCQGWMLIGLTNLVPRVLSCSSPPRKNDREEPGNEVCNLRNYLSMTNQTRYVFEALHQITKMTFEKLVVTPYWPSPTRAKQLSMATIPLCFEFFRCRVDVLQS